MKQINRKPGHVGQILVAAVLVSMTSMNAQAQDPSLEKLSESQRLQRLERMLDSDLLRQQSQTIQQLREEISSLREHIEQQGYELDSMKQRQRNLYIDMDRRLSNVEAGGSSVRAVAPVPPPNSSTTAAAPPVVAGDVDGQDAYSRAFNLLKDGQYQQSITAFTQFKQTYPNSKYADNAQYWLGEANYVSRNYKEALEAFQQLIAQFPDSSKNPGARLKIGYVYYELQNWSAARESLQQVVKLYPEETVAKKANERLQRMKREGH